MTAIEARSGDRIVDGHRVGWFPPGGSHHACAAGGARGTGPHAMAASLRLTALRCHGGNVDGGNGALRAAGPKKQSGAVLLILLAILALAGASLLMSVFGAAHPQARREQQTLLLLAQAKDALAGFAAVNGRLPLPAASAFDGLERSSPCVSDADCTGFLPWAALGIEGADAWGQRLRYSVTPALTTYAYAASSAVANRTVQTRDSGGELRYVAGGPSCSVQAQCAPFVVLSHGAARHGVSAAGFERAGGNAENDDELANAEQALHFITRPASADPRRPGGQFDDLVAWLPLDLLYQRMRAARTLAN